MEDRSKLTDDDEEWLRRHHSQQAKDAADVRRHRTTRLGLVLGFITTTTMAVAGGRFLLLTEEEEDCEELAERPGVTVVVGPPVVVVDVGKATDAGAASSSVTQNQPVAPKRAVADESCREDTQHVVAPGESLTLIAPKYRTTPGALHRANRSLLPDPNYMHVGIVLRVPGSCA